MGTKGVKGRKVKTKNIEAICIMYPCIIKKIMKFNTTAKKWTRYGGTSAWLSRIILRYGVGVNGCPDHRNPSDMLFISYIYNIFTVNVRK